MKTMALILAAGALVPQAAWAQDAAPLTSASATRLDFAVTGKATRVPDVAIINAGVQTRAATAAEAIRTNAERMERVIAALRKAGVEARDIQTSSINLNPEYRYDREGIKAPELIGYNANNQVTVRFRDVAKSGRILDTLVEVGANSINGPSLVIDNPDEALDEARLDAVNKGRARAELYAKALGKRVTRLVVVNEGASIGRPPPPPPPPMMERDGAIMVTASSAIAPGEQDISVTLQMSFDLE